MPQATMASRLLDAADSLLLANGRSSAYRRRAVGTAYYAVFHALAKVCADYLTRSAPRASEEYSRVYRALEHRSLKTAFSQSPMKDNARLNEIGASVVRLQAERFRADYAPPTAGMFSSTDARKLLDLGRETVAQIEAIKPQSKDCRIFVTTLHFRERRES